MDITAINKEFSKVMNTPGLKIEGISKQQLTNYRAKDPSLGSKLVVLLKTDRLRFKDGWDE